MGNPSAAILRILGLILLSGATLQGQDLIEQAGYLTSPAVTTEGVVFSDNYGSGIYIANQLGVRTLVAGRGTGYYWTLSPDGSTLGYKRILDDGSQVPELFHVPSATSRLLHAPVSLAGQVSFLSNGSPAFMIGTRLIIRRAGGDVSYDIGSYSNIAPISPDGSRLAYTDPEGAVRIRELQSGAEQVIRSMGTGHGFPSWSPDGQGLLFADLAGNAFTVDLRTSRISALGEAFAPVWSPDGNRIAFYRKEIVGGRLTNSDLYTCRPDGSGRIRITSTPDVCEMDPSFSADGASLLCQTYSRRTVLQVAIGSGEAVERASAGDMQYRLYDEPAALHKVTVLDIPYVNQVYDTPDWFNGHAACGPTTASMLLAHYRALPPWPGWCSTPSGHVNEWGRYVADRYRFRETDYLAQANDPNGRPAQGGFGYMWSTGSPHSMMAGYYQRHGIAAGTTDSPALQTAIDEVSAGRPYSLCVDLTSAGHIVLAHAYEGNGTFVTNDPYGDKNKPGYPNYYGKNARYDWPGWNNGHINFGRYVYWAVSGSFSRPAVLDTLVDDLQIDTGFFLYNQAPVSMLSWKDANKGYNGHFWYTYTHVAPGTDSCYATWTPTLPQAGSYEVFVYIPYSNATAARYKVTTLTGPQTVDVNQKLYRDAWVSLGTFDLAAGNAGMVRLGDASSTDRQELVFDAVRWSYRGVTGVSGPGSGQFAGFALLQNYPNPFNGISNFEFRISESGLVKLQVFDLLGREVATLVDGRKEPGFHTATFDASALPSGTYLVRLAAGSFTAVRKAFLIR